MTLTKSQYCEGLQCPKILWMGKNLPDEFDTSTTNDEVLSVGKAVGDIAKGYYGEYAEIPYSSDINKMVYETQRHLHAGTPVLAEATFVYGNLICMVDILRNTANGNEVTEVKSSTFSIDETADKVKEIYLHDMSFQVYVLKNCGLSIERVSIMQINSAYSYRVSLNTSSMSVLTDCTEIVMRLQADVEARIDEMLYIATQTTEPINNIGSRCEKPYVCGYRDWCFKQLPKNNVFQIGWGMWGSKKDAAYNAGHITFADVIKAGVKLNDKQKRQVLTELYNLPPHIDKAAIKAFLETLRYPLYHLDFETFQQAIPQWNGVSPYEQIPFQYSLHVQNEPCGSTVHKEFLGKEGIDPRRDIAERLCADIPMNACTIAYNMSFEKSRIKALSALFPNLSKHLMSIHDNMVDLAQPFQSGVYYCREMGGSYSIKSVLPALCPGDPELDYKSLPLIHNGSEAMTAYATLHEQPPEKVAEIRTALLAYCRLDTLAMVKILEKLYSLV